MSISKNITMDCMPDYLLMHFSKWKKADGNIALETRCYSIDYVKLSEKPPEYSSVTREISSHMLSHAVVGAIDLVVEERGDMAKILTKEAPVSGPQNCVLVPREDWDELWSRLNKSQRAAKLWKRLAKKYFGAIGFIVGGN